MVDKKYIKMGVAAMAATALVIGLSVGITQSKKNNTSASASSLGTQDAGVYSTYDKTCSTGKSGKSGPTSPTGKSGKSGPTSPSEGKSGKSNDKRQLYPGTEEFVEASPTQRRKLRADLINGKCLLVVVAALIYYRRWCDRMCLLVSICNSVVPQLDIIPLHSHIISSTKMFHHHWYPLYPCIYYRHE